MANTIWCFLSWSTRKNLQSLVFLRLALIFYLAWLTIFRACGISWNWLIYSSLEFQTSINESHTSYAVCNCHFRSGCSFNWLCELEEVWNLLFNFDISICSNVIQFGLICFDTDYKWLDWPTASARWSKNIGFFNRKCSSDWWTSFNYTFWFEYEWVQRVLLLRSDHDLCLLHCHENHPLTVWISP